MVEVSPSNTYAPLMPDVNGTLFPGANFDNRPGGYANGRVRVFTIGRRTVETASDGNNYSRSLAAATTYYYRITCPSLSGNSISTGAFSTGTVPAGLGYGDAIPADPNHSGSYLYPTLSATDRTASTVDPHTGVAVKNLLLPGDVLTGASASMMASGFGQWCHPTPVKASDENKSGYHCALPVRASGPFSVGLFWIASDGETRFLGLMQVAYDGRHAPARGWGSAAPLLDITRSEPNKFYIFLPGLGNGAIWNKNKHYLIAAAYSGHDVAGNDPDLSGQDVNSTSVSLPHTRFTDVTPSDANFDRSLDTLIAEFDPNWTTYGSACCGMYWSADFFSGKILIGSWDIQNGPGWLMLFDPYATAATQTARFGSAAGCVDNPAVTGTTYQGMPGCFVGSTSTFLGGPGSPLRYASLHSGEPGNDPGSGSMPLVLHVLHQDNAQVYRVTLPNGMVASGSPCTMSQPAGSYITDWPGVSWVKGCSTITVSADATINTPTAGFPTSFPAAPGDLLSIDSSNSSGYELARLLEKGSDGLTWYIQRQYSRNGKRGYDTVQPNGTLDMVTSGFRATAWWNYTKNPKSSDYASSYVDTGLGGGHAAYVNSSAYGRWSIVDTFSPTFWPAINTQQGMEPDRFTTSTYPVFQIVVPGYNGAACAGNSSTPCSVESHPSLAILNPPDALTYAQVVNNHPYTGDYGLVTASEVTPAGGQLYRIRGTFVRQNYKKIGFFAHSGNRAMREVSGPGVHLATDASTQFEWCMAYNAGECYDGSQAGDIYFNAPNIANAYCTNDWTLLQGSAPAPNDICVSTAWRWTQGITIQQLGANDPDGKTHRTISNSFGKYDGQIQYWNSRTIPDGSWLFTTVASDGMIKLFKVPPMVRDAVNRAAYAPVKVTLPGAAGADGAVVEFGYAENGEGRFDCTARQEACVANAGAINPANPFYFETEAYTPLPCASGCTIALPGISGRIVEYRLKMYSGSAVTYTSPLMVTAVP